jgi:hypothetical protein
VRRPRHQARQGGDHPRHPERRRGGAEGPRRVGHRPHRRRGEARRHPGRQDHAQGRDPALPEEKLLRAIFGEKAGDVRDTSLRVPPGVEGTSSTPASSRARASRRTSAPSRSRTRASALAQGPARRDQDHPRDSATTPRSSASCSGKTTAAKLVDDKGKVLLPRATVITEETLDGSPQVLGRDRGRRRRGRRDEVQREASLGDAMRSRGRVDRDALPEKIDRSPRGRRAAAGRHQDGQGLRRHQAQAAGRRQDGRPPRQQGRHLAASCPRRTCRTSRTARRSTSCSTRSACRAA